MTNRCFNTLEISGEAAEIEKFLNGLKKDDEGYLLFKSYLPPIWVTKCHDFDTKLVKQDPEHLIFDFDSAWSPPVYGLDIIAGLIPELDFYIEFEEPCAGFHGFAFWKEGQLVDQICERWGYDMMLTDEDMKNLDEDVRKSILAAREEWNMRRPQGYRD